LLSFFTFSHDQVIDFTLSSSSFEEPNVMPRSFFGTFALMGDLVKALKEKQVAALP
jgi:hypothetical protein